MSRKIFLAADFHAKDMIYLVDERLNQAFFQGHFNYRGLSTLLAMSP
jgi:hypothetical protein